MLRSAHRMTDDTSQFVALLNELLAFELSTRSVRAISREFDLPERWLDRTLNQADGYRSPRLSRLAQLADGLRLSPEDRRRLAVAAGHNEDALVGSVRAPIVRREKSGLTLGRAVVLVRAPLRTKEVLNTLRKQATQFQQGLSPESRAKHHFSATLVFGGHDILIRITSARSAESAGPAYALLDSLYRGWPADAPTFQSTETLLLRDDLDFIESDENYDNSKGTWRAFVFLKGRAGFVRTDLVQAIARLVSDPSFPNSGLTMVGAAVIMGGFDAFLEFSTPRPVDPITEFLGRLEQEHPGLETLTYIGYR